ncbi:hypothetical protein CJ193_008965 [Pseudoglutamicibacter albus]|uniref:hypothetical protein n=1 Tax=Pseudoglutamicibacter albus TaxID=98671 RepID=UPI0015E02743|nr:hypothetical protein [Pseudoglutamicibacter albus]WIK84190.1 hypothetical protein CJ193_008965 [Pseudoglutamicibacter albus]
MSSSGVTPVGDRLADVAGKSLRGDLEATSDADGIKTTLADGATERLNGPVACLGESS